MLSRQHSSCLPKLQKLALGSTDVLVLSTGCGTLYSHQELHWADLKLLQ